MPERLFFRVPVFDKKNCLTIMERHDILIKLSNIAG